LLRHAAGTLPAGHALVVATHLRFCPSCRDGVRTGETTGGAILEDMAPADLSPGALDRAMARLDTAAVAAHAAPPVRFQGVALPAALGALLAPRWRWTGPGVRRIVLNPPGAARAERVWLLRVEPGRALPAHGHTGWEAACVLSGGFTDRTGHYERGDVAETDESARHRPIASRDEPCICLIAWMGPLTPRGVLPRLFQRLNGM